MSKKSTIKKYQHKQNYREIKTIAFVHSIFRIKHRITSVRAHSFNALLTFYLLKLN